MPKNPWINPASHGGQTKQGQDAYDKSKGIVRTATGRSVSHGKPDALQRNHPLPVTPESVAADRRAAPRGATHQDAVDAANNASAHAAHATRKAESMGGAANHATAAKLHALAAEHHEAAGNPKAAQQHRAAASGHEGAAGHAPDAPPRAMQTGAKGGSFYVSATGRKIYKKQ